MAQENKPKIQELIVVTGASSGIGKECARWFAREGYPVLCLARNVDEMKKNFKSFLLY